MDRDFFVKLVFATHRVADILPNGGQIKKLANQLLADLLLFCDANPVTVEQKRNILPRTLRQVEMVVNSLNSVKNVSPINQKNFEILENEYTKIPKILIGFLEQNKPLAPMIEQPASVVESLSVQEKPKTAQKPSEKNLSPRAHKILELLKNKEKIQVWELQKVLPEVTKRTLRRDLDELLALNLIERKGEWNNVFYTIR